MGLTKQYLRYVPSANFNIVNHPDCNVVFVTLNGVSDRFVAVGACENVIIWDMRLSKIVMTIENEDMKNNTLKKITVVKLATASKGKHIAVGFCDGSVNTFDLSSGGNLSGTFKGHNSGITALTYDAQGHMLASASKDAEAIIWDVVAEKGLYRLSGHKGAITAVQFINKHDVVVTSSKDSYIKLWDLTTGHCFKTITGHITEVWSLSVLRDDDFIVAGSNDAELRTWKISKSSIEDTEIKMSDLLLSGTLLEFGSVLKCTKVGSLMKTNTGKLVSTNTDQSHRVICCYGRSKLMDLFIFCDDKEAMERLRNRQRKYRKKATKRGENMDTEFLKENNPALQDIVRRLPVFTTESNIKSADLIVNETHIKIVVGMNNNTLALYSMSLADKNELKLIRKISLNGHRSSVKAVSFSSDNLAIFTGGSDSVKMWNRETLNCIRTVETPFPVHCLCVVPGDRHILAGLSNGHMLIIDIASGEVIETIHAHSADFTTIYMLPDELNCVTTGNDKSIKLWRLELVTPPNLDRKVLSLLHYKSLEIDDAHCAKVSPDNKLLAVALIDSTVKIYFLNTFKLFVELYGHNLPVCDLDISYDSTIIITASSDKTIRIWGLDYGDCHRRITVDSATTCVKFLPKTHQFFTTNADGNVIHWDADNFERVVTLQGHRQKGSYLSVSGNGHYLVTCGQDNVIRLFEKTEEPLVLEDQREEERAQEDDKDLATGEDTNVHGGPSLLSLPTKKTVSAEKAAELLLECLDEIKKYKATLSDYEKNNSGEKPPLPLIMTAFNVKTTDDYLLEIIKKIRLSELEEVLFLLPFASICYFIELLTPLLSHTHHDVESVVRTFTFLTQKMHQPLLSAESLIPIFNQLYLLGSKRTGEFRDLLGENMHLLMLMNDDEEEEEVVFNVTQNVEKKRKRQKRKLLRSEVINM